ncbi:unnamed protein product [Euphydryas editha]|uniref:HTH CENPB-type domain-containing protein n=1 Tax=Euphydryas editha TaxID=104508 RepID=A0AAU9TXP3_EUPED|nr:unnamed protein product [Euphydryas editha]
MALQTCRDSLALVLLPGLFITTMPPKRALWSENDLVAAVQAVQCGRLSTYKAAERYKVPRRTIRNHLQTASLKKSLGRKPLLNDEQEAELVSRIMGFAAIGLPVTPLILRRLVFKFCEKNNIKHPFNQQAKVAGKDWFKNFMKRHPDISRRKAQFMNPARAQKLNKFIVDDHFQRLNDVYDKLDLKTHPEKIYNMDEKGCRLTIHHQRTTSKMKKTGKAESTKENRESWYCHACKQDQETAMRMCYKCSKWYHEECVCLSEEDDDDFECPDCS